MRSEARFPVRDPTPSARREREVITRLSQAYDVVAACRGTSAAEPGAAVDLDRAPAALTALTDECLAIIASPTASPRARSDAADQLTVVQLLAEDVHELLAIRRRRRMAACQAVLAELSAGTSTAGTLDGLCRMVAEQLGFDHVVLVRKAEDGWDPWLQHPETATPVAPRETANAVIVLEGRPVGRLQASRPAGGAVDAVDRAVIGAVARGFARVYERNALIERRGRQRDVLRAAADATRSASADLCDAAIDFDGAEPSGPALTARFGADGGAGLLGELTARQRQIFELIALGANNAAIGAELGLAEGTVKSHVKRLLRRLGVINRSQAIVAFHEMTAASADGR